MCTCIHLPLRNFNKHPRKISVWEQHTDSKPRVTKPNDEPPPPPHYTCKSHACTHTHIHPQLDISTHLKPAVPCWHLFRRRGTPLCLTAPHLPPRRPGARRAGRHPPRPAAVPGPGHAARQALGAVRPGPAPLPPLPLRCRPDVTPRRLRKRGGPGTWVLPPPRDSQSHCLIRKPHRRSPVHLIHPSASPLPAPVGHRDGTPPLPPP